MPTSRRNKFILAAGTLLFYGDDGSLPSAILTPLTNIDEISDFPMSEPEEFETTRLDQVLTDGVTPDLNKQYEFGLIDGGNFTASFGFDEAVINTIFGLRNQRKAWKIQLSNGANFSYSGTVKSIKPKTNKKGEVMVDVTVRVSGLLTFTASSTLVTLQSVATTAAKTLTLTFSGAVTAADFIAANFLLDHGTGALPATTLVQGAANTLIATNAAWQAAPAGDTWYLLQRPVAVNAQFSGTAQ